MIIDKLSNAEIYYPLCKRIEKGLRFLKETDFSDVTGRADYEIDGKEIYAFCMDYDQKDLADCKWETHKNYIDIQYIVEGEQIFGYANKENMTDTNGYNPDKDVEIIKIQGDLFHVQAGSFALFFPDDAHMPDLAPEGMRHVKKVVVKVRV